MDESGRVAIHKSRKEIKEDLERIREQKKRLVDFMDKMGWNES
ncbi:MAG: hypothetical protein ACE5IT_09345 [bacterium]